jgi:hypothetical protein
MPLTPAATTITAALPRDRHTVLPLGVNDVRWGIHLRRDNLSSIT